MNNYLTIITLLFGLSLSAQTFDRTLKNPKEDFPPREIIEQEGSYYFLVGHDIRNDSLSSSTLYKMSLGGDIVDSLNLPNHYLSLVEFNNSLYIFSGNSTSPAEIRAMQISYDFEIINQNVISVNSDVNLLKVRYIGTCTCFMYVGSGIDSLNNGKSLIIQLDTTLELIQERYYEVWNGPIKRSAYDSPIFYDVMENPNTEGYWVISSVPMDTLPMNSSANWQELTPSIIPFDTNLVRDSINFKVLTSDIMEPSGVIYKSLVSQQLSVVSLTDSTYLISGEAFLEKPNWEGTEFDIGSVVINQNLKTLKWDFFGAKDSAEMSAIGDGLSKMDHHVYLAHTSDFGFFYGKPYPFTLRKLDKEGNQLWVKHYSAKYTYMVFSVLATSDGGALIGGEFIDTIAKPGYVNPDKDVCFFKVDSLGNLNVTGVNEVEGKIDVSNYLVYPNPAKNQLNLLKVNQFKTYEFELYDTFGRLVKTISWREDHQLVDVSSLASGIYVYRIIDQEGNVGSGKLVVE